MTDETGVTSYEFSTEGSSLDVELLDAGDGSLGRLEIDTDLDIATTGFVEEWRVDTRLVEEGEVGAEQTLRGRSLGDTRVWLEIVHRSGDDELVQWMVLDEQFEEQQLTLAAELDADADADGDDRVETDDGRVMEVFDVIEDSGEPVDNSDIDDWIAEQFGGAFGDNEQWQRFQAVSDDDALWEGADAQVAKCQAASTEGIEEDLIRQRQTLCGEDAADAEGVLSQPLCRDDVEPIDLAEWGISVRAGAVITAALVVAGTISGGWVIAGTFVGVTVAHRIFSNALNDAVSDNSDTVFDVAGSFAGRVHDDEEAGEQFSEFFGGSNGDPHFDTFDGVSYDFHGAGEFTLTESTTGEPFVVQTRQQPVEGNCPSVGINTAAATEVGDSRVAFYAEGDEPLLVDGEPAQFPGGVLAIEGGGTIEPIDTGSESEEIYEVHWPSGERIEVTRRSWSGNALLDVRVALPDHRDGQMQGLLGNFNGDPDDDIQTRDGEVLESPVQWEDLTHKFGDSWRIDPEDSLFDYADGEDTSTFTDEQFPDQPTTLEDLPDDLREDAEDDCEEAGIDDEVAFESCVIDVACTGSATLADSHTDRDTDEQLDVVDEPGLVDSTLEPAEHRILWTFDEMTGEPASTPDNVEVSAFRDPNELPTFEFTDRFDYPNAPILRYAPDGGTDTFEEAYEEDEYVEFDIEPADGAPVIVETLHLSVARGSSIGGPRGAHLRSSADDYNSIHWSHFFETARPEMERVEAQLGNIVIDEPTTFRLYATTSGSRRTVEIGDFALDLN